VWSPELTLVDILIEQKKRNGKYFRDFRKYALIIKRLSSSTLKDDRLRLLIFGSVIRGDWIPNKSDIDILIISEKVSFRARWQSNLRASILREMGDELAPFQIHFATPEVYKSWYSRFIKDTFLEV
jgi:uncharacterized protein